MICTNCGARLPENAGVCNVCGARQPIAQQMNQGMPYQMNGGAMQNPQGFQQNMYQNPNMQGYQQNAYQNPNPQGYQQNAYQNPNMQGYQQNLYPNQQGYQMNPDMGNNSKKKINPIVWIVLAVVIVAIAAVAVILLMKDNDKNKAKNDEAVEQWEQTVEDAQNAQNGQNLPGNDGYTGDNGGYTGSTDDNGGYTGTTDDNGGYTGNNSYGTTYSDWEAVSDAFVQNYWFEDFDAMINTFVEPQKENLRQGMLSYGSEEAYWSAMFSDLYDTCGTDINLNYSTTAQYQLSNSELEEIANMLFNDYSYTCYPTDGYYVCLEFYYEGNLGEYSETQYIYTLEINGSWYIMVTG